MLISYVTGRKISQPTLAYDLGTTSASGTNIYDIKNVINLYRGIDGYYVVRDIAERNLASSIKTTIDDNHPVIAHVYTRDLNPSYSFNNGHYVTVTGYSYIGNGLSSLQSGISTYDTNDSNRITSIAPWYDSNIFGKRTFIYSTFLWAVNNGLSHGWFIY